MRLKDQRARAMIASRLDRLARGHAGDVKPVGGIPHLFSEAGTIVVLLCAGDKSSQTKGIETAKHLAKAWSE
jgi:putative addiction module killer protein